MGELLDKRRLTGEILDNALSLQLTLPNMRRHGVLETRAPDSVNSTEEIMRIARLYSNAAYNPAERRRILLKFGDIDPHLLKAAFLRRHTLSPAALKNTVIGKGLTLQDLMAEVTEEKRPALRQEKRPRFG